jgi:hypothetical protein
MGQYDGWRLRSSARVETAEKADSARLFTSAKLKGAATGRPLHDTVKCSPVSIITPTAAQAAVPTDAPARLTDGGSGDADAVDSRSARAAAIGDLSEYALVWLSSGRLRHRLCRGDDRERHSGGGNQLHHTLLLPRDLYEIGCDLGRFSEKKPLYKEAELVRATDTLDALLFLLPPSLFHVRTRRLP